MKIIKKYYSEAIYKNVNKPSRDALSKYIQYLKNCGKKEQTIYQYSMDIKDLLCWTQEYLDNSYILEMSKNELQDFFNYVSDTMKSSRIKRLESSIRNFFKFCVESDKYMISTNPMNGLKSKSKRKIRKKFYLKDKEFSFLIKYFIDDNNYQLALWVSIMYDTAMKKNLCSQIKKSDILNIENNIIEVTSSDNNNYEFFLSNRTRKLSLKYLENRENDEVSSLFISIQGNNKSVIKNSTLQTWSKKCCKVLNERENADYEFSTSSFRNSSLKNFYNGTHYLLKENKRGPLSLDEVHYLSKNKSLDSTKKSIELYKEITLYKIFNVNK